MKQSALSLIGPGIRLRLLKYEDLPLTLKWRNTEDIRCQFINSDIISKDRHLKWWEKYREKNNDFIFIIQDTERLSRSVGQVSLYNINLEKRVAEYGRLMIGDSKTREKGLARRSTDLLLIWAFNTLRIERIYLEVFKDNISALNLYLQCGFVSYGERGKLLLMSISKKASSNMHEGIKE